MTSYKDTLKAVFDLSFKRGMHCSLSNIEKLCKIYNHPEKAFPSVHVAGTNGKGSVCTKIAATLSAQGYKTGLYTSPHISSFRERIQIDGEMITEEDLASILSHIQKTIKIEAISPSFFEIATLLCFLYFEQKKVDIAVIETGLGGRWDATNVILPLVSIITSIGYDHTEVLGSSLEEITREKAGICKENTPIVIGPSVSHSLIQETATRLHCPLYQSAKMGHDYDLENTAIARLGLTVISPGFPTDTPAKNVGLQKVPPCRFERHRYDKDVIFDVAHNPGGLSRLIEKLNKFYPRHKYRFLVGFSEGKDIRACAQMIQPLAHAIHIVSGPHPRLATTQDVAAYFKKSKVIVQEESIASGVAHALEVTGVTPEVLVITGSFFIMHEAKQALGISLPEDPYLWYDPLKIVLN